MKPRRVKDRKALEEARASGCIICRKAADAAHVRSRGAGGDDVPGNLLPLCRTHHQAQHALGWFRFVEKYPEVGVSLYARGWVLREAGHRLWKLVRI